MSDHPCPPACDRYGICVLAGCTHTDLEPDDTDQEEGETDE